MGFHAEGWRGLSRAAGSERPLAHDAPVCYKRHVSDPFPMPVMPPLRPAMPLLPLTLMALWLAGRAMGQTLNVTDAVRTETSLTNTAVTLAGRGELVITGTGDPLTGCTVNFTSPDAWLRFTDVLPSAVQSTILGRLRVNGAAGAHGGNLRIVQHGDGAVVVPQPDNFPPLEVFDGRMFTGRSRRLHGHVEYDDLRLGTLTSAVRSFRLKRGWMATFAQEEDGGGHSRVYIAQDGDLEVGRLPDVFDGRIRFVRVFPWRWVTKKGFAGNIGGQIDPKWYYNWNLDQNSSLNREYVAIRQTRWWPSLNQDWKARGINHLLGYNEPDHAQQANMTPAEAIAGWPDLLATGLRVGAPAITDGGKAWLVDFMNRANAANLRVDYVPVHYYRSFRNPADPAGAANQFRAFLEDIHETVQRPLWVTEFNNGANWTTDPDPTASQQAATMASFLEMLDGLPYVERYAVYTWVEDVRRVVWDDGWPTEAGRVYRDKVSPLSWRQEMADAGTGNSARYDCDGNIRDTWGNGQDGMLVGAPVFTTGRHGQALLLKGTDYVQLSPRIADTTSFTFAAWVWWNGGANWQRIFDFGADTQNYLALTPKAGSTGGLRFLMRNGGSEQQLNAPSPATNTWVHVAVTITGDTGKLFVNGTLVNTNTAMTINPVDVGTRFNYLGRSQFAADPLFNGRLDDVRIMSSALTDAQVAALAAGAPPQFTATILTKNAARERQPWRGSLAADASGGSGARFFTKMGGPAWLTVARDGTLGGVPGWRDAGLNRFAVRVTDAIGGLHTAFLDVPVEEAPGLIGRWSFDGSPMASVGVAHGTLSGGAGWTTGVRGQALQLDGADDFLTLPAGLLRENAFTIAAWVQWDGGAAWQRLIDFHNSGSESLFVTPRSGSNQLQFTIRNREASGSVSAPQLPTGQWVHLAFTCGGGIGRVFVNGAAAGSAPMPASLASFDPGTCWVGRSAYAADPWFDGRVDELVISNEALDAARIAALMNGRAPTFTADTLTRTGAVAGQAWNHSVALQAGDPDAGDVLRFSKAAGPAWLTVGADGRLSGLPGAADAGVNRFTVRVTDASGLADDAVLNVTVQPPADLRTLHHFDGSLASGSGSASASTAGSPGYGEGLFDRAMLFDGVDDRVVLPAQSAGGLTDVTIAARVKWNGGAAWQRVFDFGADPSNYLMLTPEADTGVVQFAIRSGGGATQRLSGPDALPVGEWCHVAVTLAGNTGTLYVDGAAVATGSITIDPSAVPQPQCWLGDSQTAADPHFDGAIDDFRIITRTLTAVEVAALANPPPGVAVPLDFPGWAAGIAFPAGQGGMTADPDRDGLANLVEFVLGSDALRSGATALPPASVLTAAELGVSGAPSGQRHLALRVRVRRDLPGMTLVAEAGDSPAAFSEAEAAQAPGGTDDGEFRTLTFYRRMPIGSGPRGMLRLKVRVP